MTYVHAYVNEKLKFKDFDVNESNFAAIGKRGNENKCENVFRKIPRTVVPDIFKIISLISNRTSYSLVISISHRFV